MGTVTISGENYPIYGTLAEATTYLAAKLGATAWAAATADAKAQALATATRLIKNYLAGRGYETDPETNTDTELAEADYELAYALVVKPKLQDTVLTGAAAKRRVKAGPAEVEYFVSAARGTKAHNFPDAAWVLLAAWMAAQSGGSSSIGIGYVSGACEESTLVRNGSQINSGCD